MPTLTLAICARGAQDIIGACLESIEKQTVAPDMIIVAVDDLADPTVRVAESHGARVVESQGTGLYEARNAVLDVCETDYLAFTDADCVLVPEWVERAKCVLDTRPDVAAGTGRHPPIGRRNIASWLHHMWFVVEVTKTGETDGVIGGNSYFRTEALREVGGWLKLPGHSAAEDLYISLALRAKGYRIWFEEAIAAQHNYELHLPGLWRKSVMMGRDVTVMLRATGWRGDLRTYTTLIPLVAGAFLVSAASAFVFPLAGLAGMSVILGVTFLHMVARFKSVTAAFPRWLARWVVIWPYSWGIVRGLLVPVPEEARR
jgi:glycosyltransferase involved in cell wall biosynthesis